MKRILLAIVLLLLPAMALAEPVSFEWLPNADDPPVDGYKLYEVTESGVSMEGLQTIEGVNTTSTSYEITDVSKCHYFVLTAYRGNQSSQPTAPPLEWCPETVITVPEIVVKGAPTTVIQFGIKINQ